MNKLIKTENALEWEKDAKADLSNPNKKAEKAIEKNAKKC